MDSGRIPAVKTEGGHRRLARMNVDAVNMKIGPKALMGLKESSLTRMTLPVSASPTELTVLVVEDDAATAALIASMFGDFHPSVNLLLATDGLDALLLLERNSPQILIADLNMKPFDGFRLLELMTGRPEYDAVALVVISGMSDEEIDQRGGLPQKALFLPKPLDLRRLRGFIDAHAQRSLPALPSGSQPSKPFNSSSLVWPALDV